MSRLRNLRWTTRGTVFIVLMGAALAHTLAATGALQPPAPTALQQAQPAFGASAERADAVAAPKKAQPNAAAQGALATKRSVSQVTKNLFDLEDRAIIILSGKQTTAGELKRKLSAEIAAKNGPPKTVKGGARKLDLAALNVTQANKSTAAMAHSKAGKAALIPQASALLADQTLTQTRESAMAGIAGMTIDKAGSYSSQKCLDKGPPVIEEVKGRLKTGGQAALWGRCFGDRPGRVEILFRGGSLAVGFTAWGPTAINLLVPSDVSGLTDERVAVLVTTADGKYSVASTSFVAARARVEVPDSRWSPVPRLDWLGRTNGIQRISGLQTWSVQVNGSCALDNMEAKAVIGEVRQISGFEAGPPNQASVLIDWAGTCLNNTTTTTYYGVFEPDVKAIQHDGVCSVAIELHAWAYCPVGIAP